MCVSFHARWTAQWDCSAGVFGAQRAVNFRDVEKSAEAGNCSSVLIFCSRSPCDVFRLRADLPSCIQEGALPGPEFLARYHCCALNLRRGQTLSPSAAFRPPPSTVQSRLHFRDSGFAFDAERYRPRSTTWTPASPELACSARLLCPVLGIIILGMDLLDSVRIRSSADRHATRLDTGIVASAGKARPNCSPKSLRRSSGETDPGRFLPPKGPKHSECYPT